MDPSAVESTEELTDIENSSTLNQESPENSIEVQGKSVQTSLSQKDSPDDLPPSDNFSDIFGDSFSSSYSTALTKPRDTLFTLEEESEGSTRLNWAMKGDNLSHDNLEKSAEDHGVSASSSLFDNLLDMSTPTSDLEMILQDNMADLKPVSNVDLLFGVSDDLDSFLDLHSGVKTKTPDILDFVDIQYDLAEVSGVDVTDSLTCEPLTDGWNLVSEVSSSSKKQTPDIVVTSSSLVPDLDEADGKITKKEQEEEKTDENVKEKADENIKEMKDEKINGETVEKACMEDSNNMTDNAKDINQDIDFSILELPETSHLNFDHFKHKRNISQKGSIANRKKPKRSTIQPNSEDSIFLDSTEPKPNKLEAEDEPEMELSPNDSKGDNKQETDNEVSEEASPSRKFAGSIKIPGLLEGLSKSKVFNKAERKSPMAESDKEPQVSGLVSTSVIDQALQASSSPVVTSSPPVIHPKPVVLPRVLPKPTTKTLKDTQNQTTAGEGVVRASSFRNKNSDSPISEQLSFLKGQTSLSRSASVKVTSTSANSDAQLSLSRETKTSPFGPSKLIPSKSELIMSLSPPASKPANKIPPPVSAKPSVTAKPFVASKPSVVARINRTGLGLSASFSGGRSPLLSPLKSEIKTETTTIADGKPNSGLTVNMEKKTEAGSTINTQLQPVVGVTLSIDDKPKSSNFRNDRKPLSFAQKNVDVVTSGGQKNVDAYSGGQKNVDAHSGRWNNVEAHSGGQKNVEVLPSPAAPEKTDTAVETTNSSSGESETHKNVPVTRFPPLKKPLHSGFVARTGFKGYTSQEGKKAEHDGDDVFDSSDSTTEKTSSSVTDEDFSSSVEKSDMKNSVDENSQHRKSSISGITPVKSPLVSDKPSSSVLPRKNSITGSAYNPIGFRSTIGSSDSEQRSRGSSFSSTVEAVSSSVSVSFLPSTTAPSSEDSLVLSGSQRSSEISNSSTPEQVRHSMGKSLTSSPDKSESKSDSSRETKFTPIFTPKGSDKKKEADNATNRDVKEQTKSLRESISPSSINGKPSVSRSGVSLDKKPPWNIQLKKVEKKEPLPKPEPPSKTNDSPVNWRQQLSVRQRNTVPPKDSAKPEQDTTPEWAKASIKRRQRLIESGVIRGDT